MFGRQRELSRRVQYCIVNYLWDKQEELESQKEEEEMRPFDKNFSFKTTRLEQEEERNLKLCSGQGIIPGSHTETNHQKAFHFQS